MKKKSISIEVLLLIFLTGAFFFMSTVYGADVQIAKVTNEEDSKVVKLVLETDDETHDIVGFRHDSFLSNGKLSASVKEDLDKLAGDGLLLKKSGKHKVVIMRSDNFAHHNGGDIELDTLYNGASGDRKKYQMELVRQGDNWSLERNGRKVKRIHLKSKKVFLLGTVGIADVITRGFKSIKPR